MVRTHGLSSHPLYVMWSNMKLRCYNEKMQGYKWYGAKGINVCEDWLKDFLNFYSWSLDSGWKKGLVIDRINPEDNYYPENCRFITKSENCRRPSQGRIDFHFKSGEKNLNAKLKEKDVILIREKIKDSIPMRQIAREFNVNDKIINLIRSGKIWKRIGLSS